MYSFLLSYPDVILIVIHKLHSLSFTHFFLRYLIPCLKVLYIGCFLSVDLMYFVKTLSYSFLMGIFYVFLLNFFGRVYLCVHILIICILLRDFKQYFYYIYFSCLYKVIYHLTIDFNSSFLYKRPFHVVTVKSIVINLINDFILYPYKRLGHYSENCFLRIPSH